MKQGKWVFAVAVLAVLVSGGLVLGQPPMAFNFNMPFFRLQNAPDGVQRISYPCNGPHVAGVEAFCVKSGFNSGTTTLQQLDAKAGNFDIDPGPAIVPVYLCGSSALPGPAFNTDWAVWVQDQTFPVTAPLKSSRFVGSHCGSGPKAVRTLWCPDPAAGLPQGDNWMNVPYHSTSANSMEALCQEIGPAALTLQELNPDGGTFTVPYLCSAQGGNPTFDYAHTKGRSVKIRLKDTSADCVGSSAGSPLSIAWLPNHS